MSMLGISFLNEIVRKKEVTQASQVLNHLRESVIDALKQKGTFNEQKDGMDMGLIAINTATLEMQFAGANNPLYLVSGYSSLTTGETNDQCLMTNDLLEIKGDKMPVAIYAKMDNFTNHKIQLKKDDIIYLLSDGYKDQFGGPNNKKFLSKNLKQLLLGNCEKSMNEQKDILEKTLVEWIGKGEQVDDITLLGIKI